jgi:hypothetical protein
MQRTPGIWIIAIFCAFNALITLSGLYVLLTHKLPPLSAQHAEFFNGLTLTDYALSLILHVFVIAGGVLLFLLKRSAFPLFIGAAAAKLATDIWQFTHGRFTDGSGLPSPLAWTSFILSWAVFLAILVYVQRLTREGRLA